MQTAVDWEEMTKLYLPTDNSGTIIDNDADLGDPSYRFKDLFLGGSISASVDNDTSFEFGKAHIGNIGHSDHAGFSHIDQNGTGSYALLQNHIGGTFLNAASGQEIKLRINNSDVATYNSTSATFAGNVNISGGNVQIGSGHNTASAGNAVVFASYGSGTNIAGGELQLYGGRSTGSASGGSIKFYTSPAGSSGSGANTHIQALSIDSSQNATFAGKVSAFGNSDTVPAIDIYSDSNHGLRILHRATDGDFSFERRVSGTNTEFLRIGRSTGNATFSGDVLVGSSSGNAKLEVVENITFSTVDTFGQFIIKSTGGSTGNMMNFGVDEGGDFGFIQSVNRGIGTTPLVLQRYGGNVGISQTNPTNHINSGTFFKPDSSGRFLTLNGAANGSFIMLESSSTTDNDQIGGVYFTATGGQGDAHKQVAGIDAIVFAHGTTTLNGADLRFFTKPAGAGSTTPALILAHNDSATFAGQVEVSLASNQIKLSTGVS